MKSKKNVSRHILLLDDEHSVRQALTRLLRSLGHKCTAVSTGEDVLASLKEPPGAMTTYDLIILDIKIIGGMGGIETMRKIQQMGYSIPVISMSGYALDEIFYTDTEKHGFASHLQKPFTAKTLSHEIEKLCGAAGSDAHSDLD